MPETVAQKSHTAAGALLHSLQLTKSHLKKHVGSQQAGSIIALLEDLVARLPGHDLLAAGVNDIKRAGKSMLAAGRSKEQMGQLQIGVTTFFDVAVHLKVVARHPIRHRQPGWEGPKTSTLLIGVSPALAQRIQQLLVLPDNEVETTNSPEDATTMIRWYPFRRIISIYPNNESELEPILEQVRSIDSPCRHAAFVLLASNETAGKASTLLTQGVNSVVTPSSLPKLRAELERIGNVKPRIELKVPMLVTQAGDATNKKTMWQTHNISASGILARTSAKVEVGDEFSCELSLPGDTRPIQFTIEAVRIADPDREGLTGIASRFKDYQAAALHRIKAFISKQG